jgi:hypothetical protein
MKTAIIENITPGTVSVMLLGIIDRFLLKDKVLCFAHSIIDLGRGAQRQPCSPKHWSPLAHE